MPLLPPAPGLPPAAEPPPSPIAPPVPAVVPAAPPPPDPGAPPDPDAPADPVAPATAAPPLPVSVGGELGVTQAAKSVSPRPSAIDPRRNAAPSAHRIRFTMLAHAVRDANRSKKRPDDAQPAPCENAADVPKDLGPVRAD